jgi:hypothetical protein
MRLLLDLLGNSTFLKICKFYYSANFDSDNQASETTKA